MLSPSVQTDISPPLLDRGQLEVKTICEDCKSLERKLEPTHEVAFTAWWYGRKMGRIQKDEPVDQTSKATMMRAQRPS